MAMDLVSSSIKCKNILNNIHAIQSIQKISYFLDIILFGSQIADFIEFKLKICLAKYMAKNSYGSENSKVLILLRLIIQNNFGSEINFTTKMTK